MELFNGKINHTSMVHFPAMVDDTGKWIPHSHLLALGFRDLVAEPYPSEKYEALSIKG